MNREQRETLLETYLHTYLPTNVTVVTVMTVVTVVTIVTVVSSNKSHAASLQKNQGTSQIYKFIYTYIFLNKNHVAFSHQKSQNLSKLKTNYLPTL